MNNLFDIAEACLYSSTVHSKLELSHHAKLLSTNNQLVFDSSQPIQSINEVQFPTKPLLQEPRFMPKRNLNNPKGMAAFFMQLPMLNLWQSISLGI